MTALVCARALENGRNAASRAAAAHIRNLLVVSTILCNLRKVTPNERKSNPEFYRALS
jgi:hypothetical protein